MKVVPSISPREFWDSFDSALKEQAAHKGESKRRQQALQLGRDRVRNVLGVDGDLTESQEALAQEYQGVILGNREPTSRGSFSVAHSHRVPDPPKEDL